MSSDSTSSESDCIDITAEFLQAAKNIPNGQVVKSDLFSLLEGTRGLEILNLKLDTTLIKLSKEEENFNTELPLNLDYTLSICDKLLRHVFLWLNNSTLTSTVLSCRYMENLLVNYSKNVLFGINVCNFFDPADDEINIIIEKQQNISQIARKLKDYNFQLKNRENRENSESELMKEMNENQNLVLVHKILRSFFLGICHFILFSLTLSHTGLLLEEEDINTQSMDLTFLDYVDLKLILKEISSSIDWLENEFNYEMSSEIDKIENVELK
ncbi:Mak10p ASCRUDRAFT_72022 [Ascoidea rubescens DSM 1968]|uniref:NAA35-like N-terminal domain-containing protein n=1 Tax=Ascoidea rubescens DSM 1968 TaxID=1344418 RepID=A0A1D2VCV5_9ASCO|nr:hypothetical protein ASCRUDRAFT_72022 [Ascoidea rubescens DSM 1968]ODV59307.1 hypothetical protein ASCRUDRAFT_72022 [Ascoidea rubescens DSM 1968]